MIECRIALWAPIPCNFINIEFPSIDQDQAILVIADRAFHEMECSDPYISLSGVISLPYFLLSSKKSCFEEISLNDCIFCKNIVSGKDAYIFYRNERIIGFMDRFPVEEGHSLIIPVKHYENILTIEEGVYLEIQKIARYLSKALIDVFDADGINIGQNNGECARQVVMHYHLHIIPRHCENDIRWDRLKMTPNQLEDQARRIKASLERIMGDEEKIP